MQYILDKISLGKIVETTISLLISFAFAFVIWLLKLAHENRIKQIQLIAEIERIQAYNNGVISDYKELLKQWCDALVGYKAYATRFSSFNLGKDVKTIMLDLNFVNKYFPTIFDLERLESDISNIYESYSYAAKTLMNTENQTPKHIKNWHIFNDNLLEIIKKISVRVNEIQDDVIETIAYSQILYKKKKFSIFQLLSILNTNIYPKIKKSDIVKQINKIKEGIEKKKTILNNPAKDVRV